MTLKKYYSDFKSLSGLFAALFAAMPFLSYFLPGSAYFSPPLGDAEAPSRAGLLILAFATTYAVYFVSSETRPRSGRIIASAVLIAFLALIAYFIAFQRFVRRIDIPSRNTLVYVTVGYERTAFATSNFGSATDEEMLRARGTDEEQLRMLWTLQSLITARFEVFAPYAFMIIALVAAFSFGVAGEILKVKT